MPTKIRVLIVDDSALVRQVLSQGLGMDPAIEVVGVAHDPYAARDKIVRDKPDVLTLDVEMPRMDGVAFLRRLMPQHPLPVVMVSALTEKGKQVTFEALEAGAVDFVTKPSSNLKNGLMMMMNELRTKVKIASSVDVSRYKNRRIEPKKFHHKQATSALAESTDKVIAVGASTGGTEAIREILKSLPAHLPAGMVIVQHMPPGFTSMFAKRLNQQVALIVKEAETGDRIIPGRVLIAPGGFQTRVIRRGGVYQVVCQGTDLVSGHCPSVDVLFQSMAQHVAGNGLGVILTGMGRDGAAGMVAMREAGAFNLAQDEASSVVYGMPAVAFQKGGVHRVAPLSKMADLILSKANQMDKSRS